MPQFVDIDSLSESLTGDETLQVSDTEKVSLNQIARLFLNQDVSSEVPVPTDSNMAFDAPTIGVLLCTDTDNTIARYSVLHDNEQLYATKYMTYMPTEEELRNEIEQQKRFL